MMRIVIALDGSPAAEAAISHAAAVARSFTAHIELIRVICDSPVATVGPIDRVNWQLQKRQAEVYLARVAESLQRQELEVTYQVLEGDAAHEICQHVANAHADLLVMTRFGAGNASRYGNGGTVHKILSTSRASILLIDPMHPFDGRRGYERVMVAVDGSQCSEWAAGFAAMVARANGGSLHLSRIVPDPQLPPDVALCAESRTSLAKLRRLARTHARLQVQNLKATIEPGTKTSSSIIAAEDVASAIEHAADDMDASLLVVAAHDAPLWGPGSNRRVCESLLHRVQRPVLVLQPNSLRRPSANFRSVFLEPSESRIDAV